MVADRGLRALARRQNGNVTWEQLLAGGVTPAQVRTGLARGRLRRDWPRVYTLGDPDLIPLCRESGVLLWLGPEAVISHQTALAVWDLGSADPDRIHVTTTGRKVRPRPGVRIHRTTHLHRRDTTTYANLRLSAPARAIIECAPTIDTDRAIADAMARGILRRRQLDDALARAPTNHPGAAVLRKRLQSEGGPVLTRSSYERKLRGLIRAAGLPLPVSNARVHGFELDFYWPEHRLNVEVDAFSTHGSQRSFEHDRRRDQLS